MPVTCEVLPNISYKVVPNIASVSDKYAAALLDAYGVYWGGNEKGLLPGSKEAMEKLVSSGKIVGILSNTTQLASKEVEKLNKHGLVQGKHFHFIITSGEVMRNTFLNEKLPFETPRNKFFLFGEIHPRLPSHEPIFKDTLYSRTDNLDDADFIYISIPHINGVDQENPEVFRAELEKVKEKNLPMICPNPDQFAHEGNPSRAVVRQGSIAKMYEEMDGTVHYIGKPYNKVYTIAMDQFRLHNITDPKDILMVGDTPETDIRGARNFGMASALLTQTGIMGDRVRNKTLESAVEALPSNDTPDHLVGRL